MNQIHKGHRERMRRKFFEHGLESFENHEVLEMLLFFTRAQGDTNKIAHELINKFGSFSAVLGASADELMKVEGVGENTAFLLTMLIPTYRKYLLDRIKTPTRYLNSLECARYLQAYFHGFKEEHVVVMLFDNSLKHIKTEVSSTGIVNKSAFYKGKIVEAALRLNAPNVVVAHNHPNGNAVPSPNDIVTTISLQSALEELDIKLLDHIIVGENDYTALALSDMYKDIFTTKEQKQRAKTEKYIEELEKAAGVNKAKVKKKG